MSNKMIIHAISAVLALGLTGITTAAPSEPQHTTETTQDMSQMMGNINGMEKCFGVAKAHLNDCGSTTHSCAGEAKVDNDKSSWITVPTGLCSKIAGGSLKAPEKV